MDLCSPQVKKMAFLAIKNIIRIWTFYQNLPKQTRKLLFRKLLVLINKDASSSQKWFGGKFGLSWMVPLCSFYLCQKCGWQPATYTQNVAQNMLKVLFWQKQPCRGATRLTQVWINVGIVCFMRFVCPQSWGHSRQGCQMIFSGQNQTAKKLNQKEPNQDIGYFCSKTTFFQQNQRQKPPLNKNMWIQKLTLYKISRFSLPLWHKPDTARKNFAIFSHKHEIWHFYQN